LAEQKSIKTQKYSSSKWSNSTMHEQS